MDAGNPRLGIFLSNSTSSSDPQQTPSNSYIIVSYNQEWESYFLKVTRYRYSLPSKKSNSLPLLVTYF